MQQKSMSLIEFQYPETKDTALPLNLLSPPCDVTTNQTDVTLPSFRTIDETGGKRLFIATKQIGRGFYKLFIVRLGGCLTCDYFIRQHLGFVNI